MQSAEGITTQNPATTHTDPYLSATDSNPYSKFSRSQDHDSEMGISSPTRPQIRCYHSPDLEIREAYPLEVGVPVIESSEKGDGPVDDRITR